MISLTSIITAIKGASLATKIGLGVGAVAVVAGGTAGTVAIINNANGTPETQQITSEFQNDDNSSSEQNNTQVGETGEPEDDEGKDDQSTNEVKPDNTTSTNNNSQTATPKPNNNASNQSSSNNSSTSKPSTPAQTQPSQPSQPAQPSQPSQPAQPSQPSQPTKKPDYNLNDRYVAGYYTYPFYIYDPNGLDLQQCTKVEEKSYFAVVKFSGGGELFKATWPKYLEYAQAKGYNTYECLGMGSSPSTWETVVSEGLALDEAKCAQYGLSCGRW